jgi:hypothetical protein
VRETAVGERDGLPEVRWFAGSETVRWKIAARRERENTNSCKVCFAGEREKVLDYILITTLNLKIWWLIFILIILIYIYLYSRSLILIIYFNMLLYYSYNMFE